MMKTLDIDGNTLNMERIRFEDIQAGQTIAHLYEFEGEAMLWVSEAKNKGQVVPSWFGNSRRFSKRDFDGQWESFSDNDQEDSVVASDWHDAPAEGHTLWRVV